MLSKKQGFREKREKNRKQKPAKPGSGWSRTGMHWLSKRHTEVNARDFDQDLIHQVVKVQLDLLKELKRICDEHGLRMYAIYGTLLGAVRHGV